MKCRHSSVCSPRANKGIQTLHGRRCGCGCSRNDKGPFSRDGGVSCCQHSGDRSGAGSNDGLPGGLLNTLLDEALRAGQELAQGTHTFLEAGKGKTPTTRRSVTSNIKTLCIFISLQHKIIQKYINFSVEEI